MAVVEDLLRAYSFRTLTPFEIENHEREKICHFLNFYFKNCGIFSFFFSKLSLYRCNTCNNNY